LLDYREISRLSSLQKGLLMSTLAVSQWIWRKRAGFGSVGLVTDAEIARKTWETKMMRGSCREALKMKREEKGTER
jgi:hypothetical protein